MAIHNNLTTCGPDGSEAVGQITKDILGNYYVITNAGTYQIPEAVAESLNAVIEDAHAPVTIHGEAPGDSLLILTTKPGDANDYVVDVAIQHKGTTTDDTPTVIAAIPIGGGSDIALSYEGLLTARRTGGHSGTANDSGGWQVAFIAKGTTGPTASLIGVVVNALGKDQLAWDVQVAESGGNIEISVIGAIDNNISWFLSGHWVNAVL